MTSRKKRRSIEVLYLSAKLHFIAKERSVHFMNKARAMIAGNGNFTRLKGLLSLQSLHAKYDNQIGCVTVNNDEQRMTEFEHNLRPNPQRDIHIHPATLTMLPQTEKQCCTKMKLLRHFIEHPNLSEKILNSDVPVTED